MMNFPRVSRARGGQRGAAWLALGVCGGVLLPGCAAPNDREMIGRVGDDVRIGLLSPPTDRPETGLKPDGPSLTGLDRSAWEPVLVPEPVDGIYAWHTYARVYHFTDKTTRQRGGPVTALSALERSGPTQLPMVLETATSAPLAFVDLVLMPFKFFIAPPWEEVRSVPQTYWRMGPRVPVAGQTAPRSDAAAPAGVSP